VKISVVYSIRFTVTEQKPFNRVLLIDDAVGSGATLNEIARKLKEKYC
jgi:predicted amidophosphoribosyltransferase